MEDTGRQQAERILSTMSSEDSSIGAQPQQRQARNRVAAGAGAAPRGIPEAVSSSSDSSAAVANGASPARHFFASPSPHRSRAAPAGVAAVTPDSDAEYRQARSTFHSWALQQKSSGVGGAALQTNLQAYMNETNTSVKQVASWLDSASTYAPPRDGPADNFQDLRLALASLLGSTKESAPRVATAALASSGTLTTGSGILTKGVAAQPRAAHPPAPHRAASPSPGMRPPAHPKRPVTAASPMGGAPAAPAGAAIRRVNMDLFFTLSSNPGRGGGLAGGGAPDTPQGPSQRVLRPYLSRNNTAARTDKEALYVSTYISRAQSALAVEMPVTDAAAQEVAAWGSREDDDFVTPWYTYGIRVLMPPLALLICYFIYWRVINLVRVNDPNYYDDGFAANPTWWELALAWTFVGCEIIAFLFGMTHWVWMWNLKFRKRISQSELGLGDADLPTIDIMVPCYSEPTEIVEMTVKACYDMDYPAEKITIYVCDDGKSDDMRDMVHRTSMEYKGMMKTRYIARTKTPGVPHHAKAGNLNNCILNEGSSGQLIIVLDCDMLPEPCMARTVAPFFFKKPPRGALGPARKATLDPTVGLLQSPQAFYNLDSKDLLGQSYAFFYECQLSGWDGSGCTPCCGTGVTFARSALEAVGGFSVGSITEDFKTSLNLCANGYQCKYFLQRMTRGVSPKELNAFMIQRQRWAVGAIQILRGGNPLFTKGLHARARWLYFWSTVGIVAIIPVCIMTLIMYGTIIAGAAVPFGPPTFTDYLLIGGSTVVLSMVLQVLAGWRLHWRDYLRALQDNFTVFATLLRAILIGFCGIPMGFAVTAKGVTFDLKANLTHAAPHLFVYFLSGTAMAFAVIDVLIDQDIIDIAFRPTGLNPNLLWYSMLWTVFLWVMLSSPPRMVLYGWRRARREARSPVKCTNENVPALQELPTTPMNTFPPLSPELWAKKAQQMAEVDLEAAPVATTAALS